MSLEGKHIIIKFILNQKEVGMRKALCILLVLSFGCSFGFLLTSPTFAGAKTIELKYSSFFPAQYGLGKAASAWAEEVEKRTNGKVKVTVYPGGTLTKAVECYEGVVMGTSDIGQSCLAYTRGRFPLMEVLDLPGYPYNAIVTSKVAYDFYKKYKPKELADSHILYIHAHPPGSIITAKKPVKTLEDLKGLRIRCTGLSSKIVEALGGVPVAMPKGGQYDAMMKGVVDGTTGSVNELKGWRLAEVAKYTTYYPKVGYVTAMFITMNKSKWNSLPEDIKKIITEVSEEWLEYTGKKWNEIEVEGYKYGTQKGHQVISLPAAEGKRWEEAIQPLYDDYVKAMEAKGLPGKEALEYRNQLIEKYTKEFPPVQLQ
jgi:TRAP-type C4-dicarboxylate transport system substrate-binding protein